MLAKLAALVAIIQGQVATLVTQVAQIMAQVATLLLPPAFLQETTPALGPQLSTITFLSVGTVTVRTGVLLVTANVQVNNAVAPSDLALQLTCTGGPPASPAFRTPFGTGDTKTLNATWIFSVTPGATVKVGFNVVYAGVGGQIDIAPGTASISAAALS